MKIIPGGITVPLGFKAAGLHCGIKRGGSKDLALLFSEKECAAIAVFTKNKFKAAPVLLSKRHLLSNRARAIIVNSGNANCAIGRRGEQDALAVVQNTAKLLKLPVEAVLAASTGIIGKRLPVVKIKNKLPFLVQRLSSEGGKEAAEAILTTDKVVKETAIRIKIGENYGYIGAMAKGAGMIAPDMATMLAFITTDIAVSAPALKAALKAAVESSFNRINVDTDMSTNDSVFLLANGIAGNKTITLKDADYPKFSNALKAVCSRLAYMMVADGEGAARVLEISVKGSSTKKEAESIAKGISCSLLIKTMLSRGLPNWGRVAAAVGAAVSDNFKPEKLNIWFGNKKRLIPVMKNGAAIRYDEVLLKKAFSLKEVCVVVDLNEGDYSAVRWTSDISEEYVRINAK